MKKSLWNFGNGRVLERKKEKKEKKKKLVLEFQSLLKKLRTYK